MSKAEFETQTRPAKTLVIQPNFRTHFGFDNKRSPDACLEEAIGLCHAINLDIVEGRFCPITRPSPATLIGRGQVEAITEIIKDKEIELAFINHNIAPLQQRNLEKDWNCKVIDRTGLILEIFGARARTREGQLQVELAALSYQRSRLVRSWTHLERQRGGYGFLGGPGESQLEIDRRLIDNRIIKIKEDLEDVRRTRGLHRKARERAETPVIALVGYTNAGKSTLFNQMTGEGVFVKDLLFATLDTTMRTLDLPSGRKAVLSDTVGFISDLPTHLVESFRATLEEVETADIILHVRDISHPDTRAQKEDVEKVLESLGIQSNDKRLIEVFNKIDLLSPHEQKSWVKPDKAALSALSGAGIKELLQLLERRLEEGSQPYKVKIKHDDGSRLAWLYDHGKVISRRDGLRHIVLDVVLSKANWGRYQTHFHDKN